ncbi:nucleotidyl transferase AbiEii/AbiGii toxin family protein [Ornithobacterium rhinotracheale]|uniref:Nucleotidyl transferase AbiEii/AbiGii toxin family protein n=3 Tax=Ornithobacterium rhinotracheale TaxID=28251 RepID=I4A2K6_ORNRL|nr:nucleotidyl transferase AbiEii/AbiGii toxin family protein [Ornithobacterium rhinotracheale]AFL98190.1 protein of unknown function (DUF1814) [Ornithobacterium rhinotracheale DSM 15997]AIP99936.1 nucleotidyltransferase [Ornithobacterium rhinotracheale ORT-UMN 88]KGB66100.1 nucleotidyltransferase [Ornithobacterium rhinotracheale H06-030791]MBN3662641.1 nucleotidyl transferase AbiEii/AbiGii toxin family protein [Ornithobacterium rhinotracheale]MCK0193509.1 nucleotidyl transferase AbiEii/AbiGii
MIPKNTITYWRSIVPWQTPEQVEQDLIICKALVEIYKDAFLSKHLAFRGGTALHKLYLSPQPRYSEDIDLVQIKAEPIKETIDRLRQVLSFLGEPYVRQKRNNNVLIFKVASEIPPVVPIRLKIEINCKEHFTALGFSKVPFEVDSPWYKDKASIITYSLEELIATKLRALYQRRKGRDLFDLYKCLTKTHLDIEKIIQTYHQYMNFSEGQSPTQKQFLRNLELKLEDSEFLGDTALLLHPSENYDHQIAYEKVRTELIEKI